MWRDYSAGQNVVWYMSGATLLSAAYLTAVPDTSWILEDALDLNGNGSVDLVWRNRVTGANLVWFMSGATHSASEVLPSVSDQGWQIEDPN